MVFRATAARPRDKSCLCIGMCRALVGALIIVWFSAGLGIGAPAPPRGAAICEKSAEMASRQTGVPLDVLRAISLTETGRRANGRTEPWPWTVNMEGRGQWFASRREAMDFVTHNMKRGAVSFDVGCFQLNYKWHGQAFASVDDMFDPAQNALYAARYLLQLYAEKGNWSDAAGVYHSRTPKFAARYKRRFRAFLAARNTPRNVAMLAEQPARKPAAIGTAATDATRKNTFPLFVGAGSEPGALGSLLPAAAGLGRPRFIGGVMP